MALGKGGKPQDAKGKSKSKVEGGKDKSKSKGKGGHAKAVFEDESLRASAVVTSQRFPRNAVGLDSWANIWLIHSKRADEDYPHSLNLAHGKCKCRRDIGRKGVPRCFVPWDDTSDNINLFPEGFLWERGCKLERGDKHILVTPKCNIFTIKLWGSLPYLTKNEVDLILHDLPEASTT